MLRSMMCEALLPDPGLPAPAGTAVWTRTDPEMPAWVAQVVKMREFLSDCAFVYNVDGTPQYWKMVYMVQSPKPYIAVSQLHPIVNYSTGPLPAHASVQDATAAGHDYAFECNFGVMQTAAYMPLVGDAGFSVLFGLSHVGDVVVTARGQPNPLSQFLGGQPTPQCCLPQPSKEPQLDKEYEGLVMQMPWLRHLEHQHSFVQQADAASSRGIGATPALELEVDEDEIFRGLDSVDRAD